MTDYQHSMTFARFFALPAFSLTQLLKPPATQATTCMNNSCQHCSSWPARPCWSLSTGKSCAFVCVYTWDIKILLYIYKINVYCHYFHRTLKVMRTTMAFSSWKRQLKLPWMWMKYSWLLVSVFKGLYIKCTRSEFWREMFARNGCLATLALCRELIYVVNWWCWLYVVRAEDLPRALLLA